MDDQSRRVAEEIISAGVAKIRGPVPADWESLAMKFLGMADGLSEMFVNNFGRNLKSVQGPEPEAAEVREWIASDMHRRAAGIVTIGGEAAVAARLLQGASEPDARLEVTGELGALLDEENLVPGEDADELIKIALRNYAFAAVGLHDLRSDSDRAEAFLGSLYELICGSVKVASIMRADESQLV